MNYSQVYHRPQSLSEALVLLDRPDSVVLAGGTHVVPRIKEGHAKEIIDIQKLGFHKIRLQGERVWLGAMVSLQALAEDLLVPECLRQCALYEGTQILRNQATLGGTIVVASTESEILACLLTLDAQILLATKKGEELVPLPKFLAHPFPEKGIITAVSILNQGIMAWERVARTPFDRTIVSVIGRKDSSEKVRLAFCGLGKTPLILEKNSLDSFEAIEDFRGSREYRLHLAKILSERVTSELEKSNANSSNHKQ